MNSTKMLWAFALFMALSITELIKRSKVISRDPQWDKAWSCSKNEYDI